MNVLILTPDRVGSTLLQRLITVYMQAHHYDKPVINLHELSNGLIKYYSTVFNQEVLGKPNIEGWKYFQSLAEIKDFLKDSNHYVTSRLAHYHIVQRQDTMAEQVPFYQYLNQNFFIISARRRNLFEHALSWCIYLQTKKLNVYDPFEKINTYATFHRNPITVHPETLINYLDRYIQYINWCDQFDVSSYFKYEEDLPKIEQYIHTLPLFQDQAAQNWKDIFGIEFKDWNRCHYLLSNLNQIHNQLAAPEPQVLLENDTQPSNTDIVPLPHMFDIRTSIVNSWSSADRDHMLQHQKQYVSAHQAIKELVKNKILVTGIPIKLQTLAEKRKIIKNFDQLINTFNTWRDKLSPSYGDLCDPMESETIHQLSYAEEKLWHPAGLLTND